MITSFVLELQNVTKWDFTRKDVIISVAQKCSYHSCFFLATLEYTGRKWRNKTKRSSIKKRLWSSEMLSIRAKKRMPVHDISQIKFLGWFFTSTFVLKFQYIHDQRRAVVFNFKNILLITIANNCTVVKPQTMYLNMVHKPVILRKSSNSRPSLFRRTCDPLLNAPKSC